MPHAVRTRRSCERGDPAAYVRRAVAGRERPSHQVVAIVHAPADGVRRGIGRWGHVEAVDETTCRVVMHVDDLAWPLMALGSVGAELERSEEHTSELQSLMRISYAVFCLKKK